LAEKVDLRDLVLFKSSVGEPIRSTQPGKPSREIRGKMKIIGKILVLSVLVLALSSCNAFTAKPTQTPTPSATSTPTLTSTSRPTSTPTLVLTDTPSTIVLSTPAGKPVSNWEGIPVMPTALAGEGDSKGYSFIVKASLEAVQNYYANAMSKLGWNMFASGQGTTGNLLVMFMKGTDLVTVSIISQPDGMTYVILVK
jgi:hypothetical protein